MKTLATIFTVIGVALLAKYVLIDFFSYDPHGNPQVAIAFLLMAIAINTRAQKP